jgi:hypothetical protein
MYLWHVALSGLHISDAGSFIEYYPHSLVRHPMICEFSILNYSLLPAAQLDLLWLPR